MFKRTFVLVSEVFVGCFTRTDAQLRTRADCSLAEGRKEVLNFSDISVVSKMFAGHTFASLLEKSSLSSAITQRRGHSATFDCKDADL